MDTFDLIIIGAGPGGYIAAERAGAMGKKVLIIEKEQLGGVCTNWGCIPTKSLLNSAKQYVHAQEADKFGVHIEKARFELSEAMEWKNEVVQTLRDGIQYLMKKNTVTVEFGEAEVTDAHHVKVNDTVYTGSYIMIASGSSPAVPPIPGVEQKHVLTSKEILSIDAIPKKLAVIGGGVIGMEFASFFSSVGSEVHVVEMLDEILPLTDKEFAKLMRREMKQVKFHLGCRVEKIDEKQVHFTNKKGKAESIEADTVLMSVGRRPNVQGFEDIGLDVDGGRIVVDERMRTNIPSIYAVGDVNGKSLLAHSASRMGEVAVANMFGDGDVMRYHAVPWAVYTQPEAAGCGLTEQDAEKEGRKVLTASMQMRANGRFLAEHGKRAGGLCKVVVDAETKVLLGVHLLGAVSSEMIYGAAAMIEAELRVKDIKEIIFPHPSVSEIIRDTIWELKE
ncbi:MAG: dihydrolipoyl dehydrogenase [Spirochaetia bacterium]|nr:dihydrolipoyl dehydrogenase [Spirochaetia bacterium]